MSLGEALKEEFKLQHFLLEYKNPGKFAQFECGYPRLYIAWRVTWAVYHFVALIVSGVLEKYYATTVENRSKWFIFLTNWVYLSLTVSALIDAASTVFVQRERKDLLQGKNEKDMPWYLKVLWVFSNITNVVGILVSVCYWEFGPFDPKVGIKGYHCLPFLTHGMNIIYIVVNLSLTGAPVRLFHFWHSLLFVCVYGAFGAVYMASGGTDDMDRPYIYPPLNWKANPIKANCMSAGIISGTLVFHGAVFLIYMVRRMVVERCCRENEENFEKNDYEQI